MSPSLPFELIAIILEETAGDSSIHALPFIYTSHAFRDLAEPLLYRTIDMQVLWRDTKWYRRSPETRSGIRHLPEGFGDYTSRKVAILLQRLAQSRRIAGYVNSFTAAYDAPIENVNLVWKAFKNMVNLKHLALLDGNIASILTRMPYTSFQLTHFHWGYKTPMSENLVHFLSLQPRIQHLTSEWSSCEPLEPTSLMSLQHATVHASTLSTLLPGRNITSLNIMSCYQYLPVSWGLLESSLNKIEHLIIGRCIDDPMGDIAQCLVNVRKLHISTGMPPVSEQI
jgi:hypothetical protein